jgi:hypothetical protein
MLTCVTTVEDHLDFYIYVNRACTYRVILSELFSGGVNFVRSAENPVGIFRFFLVSSGRLMTE